ncbi:MAG: hypothetical protein NTX72_04935 [Candidatus Uhrbacteria bacterium]|nr:hypothetical protein [Candidatus Uhrbacteria bacterium]
MKGFYPVLTFLGAIVLVVGAGFGIRAIGNVIVEQGYNAHALEVADQLDAGKVAKEKLTETTTELKTATDKVAELSKQLEATKTASDLEHIALMNTFDALVTVKAGNDECEKKYKDTAYEKCTYRNSWFQTHHLSVSDGAIWFKKKDAPYYGPDLAKYEFVRSADGKVIDFKLVLPKDTAQK